MLSLEEIVGKHAGMVRRIATVYERHPDRIDDLVQEVWLAVWQALPRLDNPSMLKPYIARITQNICVTHVRRALVRKDEPLGDGIADMAMPVDEATDHARQLARLTEVEIPIKEIATILGISESNTSVRLHRAKTFIRLNFGA